jgi:DNA modification methylase
LNYDEFLAKKVVAATERGMEPGEIHPALFDFQAKIVSYALRKGSSALFANTGLGKTIMQLEWARHVPGRVLILAPLAVGPQTVREAESKLGLAITYARNQEDADRGEKITITNYEMLDHFDVGAFTGVVLDESSILKSLTGKTKTKLIERFKQTPFKLACTATPAPNDHMELGNHAEFLGIMPMVEMLARWFKHDSGETSVYRLKRHGEQDFWRWVASWAVCCRKPSDVGPFDDSMFDLPPLNVMVEPVEAPEIAEARGQLFAQGEGPSATTMWKEKAETREARCWKVAELVTPDKPWVIWCETNEESTTLSKLIPGAVEVKGSMSLAEKEARLDAFSTGQERVLVTKPSIAGFGLNWQHCADVAFAGLSYSFEALYQAIRRTYRFGQTKPVNVHLVTADSEVGILDSLERKRKDHERMQDEMVAATRSFGIGANEDKQLRRVVPSVRKGEDWTLHNGDNIEVLQTIESDSVGLSVFSPPFADLFVYSDSLQDMGNCASVDEFFEHMDFLAPELLRVTQPGRLACVHCSELPVHKHRAGVMGIYDFPGDLVKCFEKAGWVFHSRITIWKNPVVEMTRTKAIGLLHRSFESRRETCRVGMPDYVLVFRKWTPDMPDRSISGLASDYIGTEPPPENDQPWNRSVEVWEKYASPVWFDINQTNVLQFRQGRDATDEKHICPLQLDVIERCIWMWSNEGDTVLDPFMGIGSVGYCALKHNRKALGIELKESYANVAVKHFEQALAGKLQETLAI